MDIITSFEMRGLVSSSQSLGCSVSSHDARADDDDGKTHAGPVDVCLA